MAIEGQEELQGLELIYSVFKDGLNLSFDSLKHLTTLNAGSIVLIATFLSNIFSHQMGLGLKLLVAGSFALFGLSLAAAAFLIFSFMRARHQLEDLLAAQLFYLRRVNIQRVNIQWDDEDSTEAARSTEAESAKDRQSEFPNQFTTLNSRGDEILDGLMRGVERWRMLFSWVIAPFILFFLGLGSFGFAVILNLF